MTWIESIIIAIVEGLTEFLPVSSTGHMIITQGLLGMESTPFLKAFTVIIQFGAILSVICLYWRKFFYPETMQTKGYTWWQAIWRMLVAVMLIVGGVFMLFCDRLFSHSSETTPMTLKRAFLIGCFQCISMIPGVSRSMATIVGGMAQKLTRKAAAEFSFFLAVPTMFGATCLELYKLMSHDDGNILTQGDNLSLLLVGCVVAFVVAILAIKFFINYVAKYGFVAFGWYRIIVGAAILIMAALGYELTLE